MGDDSKERPLSRLLIVDDELFLINAYRRVLGEWFEVSSAHDAGTTRRALAETDFDVVLVEVAIPGSGESSLARELIEHRPELVRRMVLTCGGRNIEEALELRTLHELVLLLKPVEPQALVAALRGCLARGRRQPPDPPASNGCRC